MVTGTVTALRRWQRQDDVMYVKIHIGEAGIDVSVVIVSMVSEPSLIDPVAGLAPKRSGKIAQPQNWVCCSSDDYDRLAYALNEPQPLID
jgi:hypothetical protein